jgi:adenylyltransferase/sulfurtransferase
MSALDERYARQRLIPGWDQRRLAVSTVLVAGAGALGNEVLKNLALLGVGNLLILDVDHVERSNLSRTLLFREADIGDSKARAAARAIKSLNPDVRVTAIEGDLRFVLGLGRLHGCTLALGCLDNQGARAFLSRMCVLARVPLLDAGMWALGGEVRAFLSAEGPCFDCTLAPDERRDLWLRYSCSGGFRVAEAHSPAPTVVTTAAVVGGVLAQETARLLNGQPPPDGSALVYNGQAGRMYRTMLRRDPNCPNHTALDWDAVQLLPAAADALTAHDLLAQAQASLDAPPTLDLGRDLLLAFDCPGCGRHEPVERLMAQIDEAAATCPHCGARRDARVTSTVTAADPWAGWSLAQLGVPEGEVLSVRAGEALLLYQLSIPTETL